MTGWIVLGVIVLLIVLLLLLRVGVRAVFDEDGFVLYLRVWFLRFKIIPMKKKQLTEEQKAKQREKERKKKEKKARKEQAKKDRQEKKAQKKQEKEQKQQNAEGESSAKVQPKPKKRGDILWLLQLMGPALHALGQLRRKLCIHRLQVSYAIGGMDDPAGAAIQYGQISAGGGALFPLINAAFDVRDWDLDIGVDFMAEKTKVALCAEATYRIGQVLGIVLVLGVQAMRVYLRHRKETKQKAKQARQEQKGGTKHGRKASDS